MLVLMQVAWSFLPFDSIDTVPSQKLSIHVG